MGTTSTRPVCLILQPVHAVAAQMLEEAGVEVCQGDVAAADAARVGAVVSRHAPVTPEMMDCFPDLETGTFVYCNAGHNPPYRLRSDGGTDILPRTKGMALAIMEDIPQTDAQVTLAPGDSLFLFTDGVVEAQNSAQKLFEDERLEQTLDACVELPPDAVIARVTGAVQDFVQDAPQFDDITCLAVRWLPQTAS